MAEGNQTNQATDLSVAEAAAPVADPPTAPTLREPAEGVPAVCQTLQDLASLAEAFAAGTGPVALDAERASGHRYGQRAFLVQAKRAGSGIGLIDPEALPDLGVFAEAIADAEWVLHSSTQDLACLEAVGLRPRQLFDTELAARLLGLPRVGLASLTESLLGWHLAKGHSAADWSIRPLPPDYLRYAALDVELLLDLRDILAQKLVERGRWTWAQQEFSALLEWTPRPRTDPWRRTAGSNKLRQRRQLAVLRSLWEARDLLAQQSDVAPGRVLQDAALVAAAEQLPSSPAELLAVPGFKRQQRRAGTWLAAVRAGKELPGEELPALRMENDGPPNPRSWAAKDPVAAARFTRLRACVLAAAQAEGIAAEVLISPDTIRRLAWSPPDPIDLASVSDFLAEHGARPWQVDRLAAALSVAGGDAAGG